MKKALVISYIFPPSGGGGVQRTAKFASYLPNYNWLPTILTVTPSSYALLDSSHESMLPKSVEIIRTFYFDPVARYASHSKIPDKEVHKLSCTKKCAKKRSLNSYLRLVGLRTWNMLDEYFFIPDQAMLWIPFALFAGFKASKKKLFNIIYATGEPYSSFITAYLLSRLLKIPYVLDMRDPWTLSPYRNERRPKWRKSLERWMETKVLASCRACVFANQSLNLYAGLYPQWADKFYYLPNGFDAADFDDVEPKKFDKFTFVHSGTFLSGYRTADAFLHAVRSMLDKQPSLVDQIQIFFVGKIGEERQLINDLRLERIVYQTGYLPHHESISYLMGANVLLLIGGEHKWEETGKIYEYLVARRPILAIVNPAGAAADVLRNNAMAKIVNRENIDQIAAAVDGYIDKNYQYTGDNVSDQIALYDRKKLTQQLAKIMNDCLCKSER